MATISPTGRFITLEGQDGAGKSTNLAFIRDYLSTKNLDVHLTREPGGTALGETLREILLYGRGMECGDLAELLLMFAARAQHLEEVIYPRLKRGVWVVSDRFTDATYAYQGAGRGLEMCNIETLEALVQEDFRPDLTLLLDIPLKTAKSRGAADHRDRFERLQDGFKCRVRDWYLAAQKAQPERIRLVDASRPIEMVQAAIAEHLDRLVNESGQVYSST